MSVLRQLKKSQAVVKKNCVCVSIFRSGKTPNTFTTYLLNQGYVAGPYKVCAPPVSCNKGYSSKYRTFDGSCNSQKYPRWGQAKTAFNRLLPPAYSDG
jgi:Animal haem peroxidase